MPDTVLNVTLIPPSGIPEKKSYPDHTKVEHVIKDALPPGEKQNWQQYQCADGTRLLSDPNQTLKEAGVKDGDTLVVTKKEGGGGRCSPDGTDP
jgi:hypothetical protein